MTAKELRLLMLAGPPYGLTCTMADGKRALLVRMKPQKEGLLTFGFQVPGEDDIRYRTADKITNVGGDALVENAPQPGV